MAPRVRPKKDGAASIAVIGGGASGALMAAHLIRLGGPDMRLTLVEPRAELGRGLAYATRNDSHRLNVRASNMSAFPDDPDHFWRWLKEQGHAGEDCFCFVPRGLYGRYLASLIEGPLAAEPRRVRWRREAAVGLSQHDGSISLRFSAGGQADFDVAVLCCGHGAGEALAAPFVTPWEEPGSWNEAPDSTILILGTGQTMVDAAISLHEFGHRGPIVAVSRRGLLPQAHRRADPAPIAAGELPSPAQLALLLRWLRQRARDEMRRGGDWRSGVDGLRPHTQAIWRAMPTGTRVRFLEHARPWWDVHRHRMAPEVAEKIEALRGSGQLRIVAGRVLDVSPNDTGAAVSVRPRGAAASFALDVSRIVSCRGLTNDPRESANPLLRNLLAGGNARADPLGVGLDVDGECRLIDRDGRASDRLFAIGPMSQAAFWEVIAIPDIRLQAAALARRLTERGLAAGSPKTSAGSPDCTRDPRRNLPEFRT